MSNNIIMQEKLKDGTQFSYNLDDKILLVDFTLADEVATKLIIPDTIDNFPVTCIKIIKTYPKNMNN